MNQEKLADVLSEFARTMVTDFRIQGILDHLVARIVEAMPITAAGVTLITPDLKPRYVAASSPRALLYEKLQTELGEGPCLAAYETGQSSSISDLRVDDRFARFGPRALEAGLVGVFTFPLHHRELRLGALNLYRDTAGPLTPEDMIGAHTLADVAAAYLINAQARADLADSTDQAHEAALHDSLTGLPNRTLILQLIEHAVRASRRSQTNAAVIFVDLNRFKEVNDTYGHQKGDELLVAVAGRLRSLLRPGDSVARLGGDEFVILCEEITDLSSIDSVAVRLDAALSRPFDLSGIQVSLSASIGIALTGQGATSPDELLLAADLAMYTAKRGRIDGQDDVLDLRRLHLAGHQAGLSGELSGAIDREEMHLEYQPIVQSAGGEIAGIEAMIRWTHPLRGPISPAVFIPAAEQSGLMGELGRWALEQACADRQRCQQHSAADLGLLVNVSAHQFMSAHLARTVAAALAATATDPSSLTLEVTEGVLIRGAGRALAVFKELKQIGVKLALADFGTGYSSLGYLSALPIDTIKIDRSFVAKLTDQPSSRGIVSAIITLAHGLGMVVIAEGVETPLQSQELTELGSDFCQGYQFAKPIRATLLGPLIMTQADGHAPSMFGARALTGRISVGSPQLPGGR